MRPRLASANMSRPLSPTRSRQPARLTSFASRLQQRATPTLLARHPSRVIQVTTSKRACGSSCVTGSARRREQADLCLLPRLGTHVTTILAARPLTGERTIRMDLHDQDCGSALGQAGHRQNVAEDFAYTDLLAVVPFQLEGAGG